MFKFGNREIKKKKKEDYLFVVCVYLCVCACVCVFIYLDFMWFFIYCTVTLVMGDSIWKQQLWQTPSSQPSDMTPTPKLSQERNSTA